MEKIQETTTMGGVKVVGDVLNQLGEEGMNILKTIKHLNEDMATDIKNEMFTFNDVLLLEKEYLIKVLSELELNIIAISMKNKTEEDLNKIKDIMSLRKFNKLKEELELLGKIKSKQIEEAQKQIINLTLKKIENGEITKEMEEYIE